MAMNSKLMLQQAYEALQSGRNDEAIEISTKAIEHFSQQKRKPSALRSFHSVRMVANNEKGNRLVGFYELLQIHFVKYDDPATAPPPPSNMQGLTVHSAEFKPPFDVHPGSRKDEQDEDADERGNIPSDLHFVEPSDSDCEKLPNLPARPFVACNCCCCDNNKGENEAREKARRTIAWITEGNFSVSWMNNKVSERSPAPKLKKKQNDNNRAANTVERFRHDGSSEYKADSELLLCIRNRSSKNDKGESLYTGTVFCFRACYNRTVPIEEVQTTWHETWMDHVLCSKANTTNQRQRESIVHRVLQLFLRHLGLNSLTREIGFLLCCYLLRRLTTPGCCKLGWMEEIADLLAPAQALCLASILIPEGHPLFSNTKATRATTHVLSPDAVVSRLEPIAREMEGFLEFKGAAVDHPATTIFGDNLMESVLGAAAFMYQQFAKLTTDEHLVYQFLNKAGALHQAISGYSYAGMLFWDAWQIRLPCQRPRGQRKKEMSVDALHQIWTDQIDVTTTLQKLLSVYSCHVLAFCNEKATQDTTTALIEMATCCALFGLLYVSNFHCVRHDDDEIKRGSEMDFLEKVGPSCKEFLKPEFQSPANAQDAVLGAMFLKGHIEKFHQTLYAWSTRDINKLSTCIKQAKHFASQQGVELEEKKDKNNEVAGHLACCHCGSFGKLAGCFLACSCCGAEETLPGCFLVCPCGMRCYCCKECQRDDWKQGGHKNSCTTRTKVATVNKNEKNSNDDDDKISNGDNMHSNNDSKISNDDNEISNDNGKISNTSSSNKKKTKKKKNKKNRS